MDRATELRRRCRIRIERRLLKAASQDNAIADLKQERKRLERIRGILKYHVREREHDVRNLENENSERQRREADLEIHVAKLKATVASNEDTLARWGSRVHAGLKAEVESQAFKDKNAVLSVRLAELESQLSETRKELDAVRSEAAVSVKGHKQDREVGQCTETKRERRRRPADKESANSQEGQSTSTVMVETVVDEVADDLMADEAITDEAITDKAAVNDPLYRMLE